MRRWVLVPVFLAIAIGAALIDRDGGLRHYFRLRDDLRDARARTEALEAEVESLRMEASALEDDPIALERALREDLGLARPGEIIVQWPVGSFVTDRNH